MTTTTMPAGSGVDDVALIGDPATILADPAAIARLAAAIDAFPVVDAGREVAETGVCATVGGDAWNPDTSATSAAISICRTCPALAPCRLLALRNREARGIWGGLRAAQRRRLLRAITATTRRSTRTGKDTA